MFQFKLPDLGEGIAEAEVVKWLVQEGDAVQEDQPIAEVTTDKALLEIPSPRAGRVHRLCGKEGDVIPVGHVLIEIDDSPAEARPAEAAPSERIEAKEAKETAPAPQVTIASEASPRPPSPALEGPSERRHPPRMPPRPQAHPTAAPRPPRKPVDAVPAVRELARQLSVDIEQVPGTGPGGRVMRRDVEAFVEAMKKGAPPPEPARASPQGPAPPDEPDWTRRPLRGLRRQIAERMVRAKALIPHYTYVEEVDMTALEERRRALAEGQDRISPLAFIAHAVVRALPHYPQMNACLDEQTGEMIYKGKIHLGIAVATEEGLLVPVIRDAAGRDVVELAAMIHDLAERARAKRLNPFELRGSTFTITSLGRLGGVMATPIINYPASAILGVHAIRTLPRHVGGQVAPREILNLSISLDHRVVDGFEGARFIQAVKDILEQADFPEVT